MSKIEDVLKATGEEALDTVKASVKEILIQAKGESQVVIKETAVKTERWLVMRAAGELDDDDLKALLKARKRVVEQFLLTQEISSRAKLEKVSTALIDIIVEKFIGVIF